jgi:hypothetical protein
MAYAAASKPTQPAEEPVTASAKPAEAVPSQQTTSQPTLEAIAAFRQKHAKQSSMALADIVAGNHDVVRRRIHEIFQESCSDAEEKIADVPLREKHHVFKVELRRLQKKLGKVLRKACKEYTGLAIVHRAEIDPLGWVTIQVRADVAGTRDPLEQWVRGAVGLESSLYPPLPVWIVDPLLRKRDLGHQPSNVDLGAALTAEEAEETLAQLWMRFRMDLEKTVEELIQAARVKLAALPTSKQRTPTVRRTRKTTVDQWREEKIIREILPLGLKGPKYCRAVAGLGVPMPRHLTDSGCPASYVEAYKIPKWRKKIQDEKCDLTKIREETRHSSQASTAS